MRAEYHICCSQCQIGGGHSHLYKYKLQNTNIAMTVKHPSLHSLTYHSNLLLPSCKLLKKSRSLRVFNKSARRIALLSFFLPSLSKIKDAYTALGRVGQGGPFLRNYGSRVSHLYYVGLLISKFLFLKLLLTEPLITSSSYQLHFVSTVNWQIELLCFHFLKGKV